MNFFTQALPKEKVWNDVLIVCGGALLLFAASQIQIPLEPVPINLQTVAVMLIGLTYTPRRALQSHLLWLGLAAMGCPVLTGFIGGLGRFTGTTAGYLFGFVIAAYLMATLKQRFSLNSFLSDICLTLIGTIIVFTCGVSWLAHLIGFSSAITHGLFPFILPGIIKAGLLCSALQILRHSRRK